MVEFFHTILYVPIYNLLIFLVDVLPGGDIGLAVIAATLIVKIVIMPLSFAALRTARIGKIIQPELKAINERYKTDPEAKGKETLALYKKYGANPFASLLSLLIQLPILICLFWVFNTAKLPAIDSSLLYSFITTPQAPSIYFLGLFLMSASSITLAVIAALTQFVQAWYSIPMPPKREPGSKPSMSDDMGRAMVIQMRYVLPFLMGAFAYTSAAIALYFITTNLVGIVQEFIIRREKLPEAAKT